MSIETDDTDFINAEDVGPDSSFIVEEELPFVQNNYQMDKLQMEIIQSMEEQDKYLNEVMDDLSGKINEQNKVQAQTFGEVNNFLRSEINAKNVESPFMIQKSSDFNGSPQNEANLATLEAENKLLKQELDGKTTYIDQLIVELSKKESLLTRQETTIKNLKEIIVKERNLLRKYYGKLGAEKMMSNKLCREKDNSIQEKNDLIAKLFDENYALQQGHGKLSAKIQIYEEEIENFRKNLRELQELNHKFGLEHNLLQPKIQFYDDSTDLSKFKKFCDKTTSEILLNHNESVNFVKTEQRLNQIVLEQGCSKNIGENNENNNKSFMEVDKKELEYYKEQCIRKQVEVENLMDRICEIENINATLNYDVCLFYSVCVFP